MRCCRLNQRQLQVGQQVVVGSDQREVDRNALLDGRLGETLRHAGSVRLVGELLADRREVVLTSGRVWAKSSARVRVRCLRRRSKSLVARLSAG